MVMSLLPLDMLRLSLRIGVKDLNEFPGRHAVKSKATKNRSQLLLMTGA